MVVILTAKAIFDPSNWTFQSTMPARTRRHLNVMGGLLSSVSLSGILDILLANLTRSLRDFAIADLITEISADMNQMMRTVWTRRQSAGRNREYVIVSIYNVAECESLISYDRPPEQIARELLQAQPKILFFQDEST